ncbi:hypothethical protein [Ralstonia solanacearum PSI07]|nr:hypothethical protein [Ralstonia solanacearum PSI07]
MHRGNTLFATWVFGWGFQHERSPYLSVRDRRDMSRYAFLAVGPEGRQKRMVGLQA